MKPLWLAVSLRGVLLERRRVVAARRRSLSTFISKMVDEAVDGRDRHGLVAEHFGLPLFQTR